MSTSSASISTLTPCFIQSWVTSECDLKVPEHSAYLYDQSLVLLAFLAAGRPQDLKQAKRIADAMVSVQKKDRTFKDGRLRNAYICGDPIDSQYDVARLPGHWNKKAQRFEEDEYAVSSDTGNMAWAAIALVHAYHLIGDTSKEKYLLAAELLGRWIAVHCLVDDSWGGFCGGYSGGELVAGMPDGPTRVMWRSTEHNIDLIALFALMEYTYGDTTRQGRYWLGMKLKAQKFVRLMRQKDGQAYYLSTGLLPDGLSYNRSVIPLDVHAWSVLAHHGKGVVNPYGDVLMWAVDNCGAKEVSFGYDFNCHDGDGVWWEGTAQMALALKIIGKSEANRRVIRTLKKGQILSGEYKGALPAASKCGLTTGIHKLWGDSKEPLPWLYSNNLHVGTTAWFVFALLGKNPFFLLHQ